MDVPGGRCSPFHRRQDFPLPTGFRRARRRDLHRQGSWKDVQLVVGDGEVRVGLKHGLGRGDQRPRDDPAESQRSCI